MFHVEPIPNVPAADGVGPHDAFGLRGYNTSENPPIKVLIFGGASIYAHGKATKEAIPALVAEELVKLQKSALVGNAGCPGQCAASAMLRLHFSLSAWKPTHIVYSPGGEDWSVYAAQNFQSDLNHVPRPWSGSPFPFEAGLSPAGAAAYERDLRSLDVVARMNEARLILCMPIERSKYSPLRAPILKVSQQRRLMVIEQMRDADEMARAIARGIAKN